MDSHSLGTIALIVLATAIGLVMRHKLGSRDASARTAGQSEDSSPADETAGAGSPGSAPRATARPAAKPAIQDRADGGARAEPVAPSVHARRRLAAARSWAYWLQNINIRKAAATPYDVLVVDYSRDGSDGKALRPAEVESLQQKPDGSRRFVGCYLSIGEAEDYRYYWQESWRGRSKPQWIRAENKDWAGNYVVNFWDAEWQALLMGSSDAYLDKILAQGFDAVYLDRADVYYELKRQRPTAERDMVELVRKISAYAKARNPNFGIIMQNAEELLEHEDLRAAIDAIAKEDLIYGVERDGKLNSKQAIEESVDYLNMAKKDGISVFVVEYVKDPDKVEVASRQLGEYGYVATYAPRNLGQIYDQTIEA